MQLKVKSNITVEEYLVMEEQSDIKHEYIYGNLYAMPGATVLHNQICFFLRLILMNILSKDYLIVDESVKVKIENEDYYTYPDVAVTNELNRNNLEVYVLHHPVLIAEVLSDSTRKYDLTDKFIQYQKISSLQYYITVEPAKHLIHLFEKATDGEWSAKTFTELTETINLPELNAAFVLADIYK